MFETVVVFLLPRPIPDVGTPSVGKYGKHPSHREVPLMSARHFASAALGVILLSSSSLAENPLKSGPQVGELNNRRGFSPKWIAGPLPDSAAARSEAGTLTWSL